jgi:hypothetical protein
MGSSLEVPSRRVLGSGAVRAALWVSSLVVGLGATPVPSPAAESSDAPRLRSGPITEEERAFWSFQPLRAPAPPSVRDASWPIGDIDRFILASIETAGLSPSPDADPRTFVRRLTFDLTGLPPTREELAAFLADARPDAPERLVDRLLSTRAYAERQARRWLDVVRYADTAGETADFPVREAYLYRDWVIDAYAADRPYDAFLREQIAGDILARAAAPERHEQLVTATGFLAISRRFGFDPENYHHLTIQDTIDTIGQAVLGLSLGCARCHDHKYDPISTADYYALYGIFESTKYAFPGSEKDKRPFDFVPAVVQSALPEGSAAPLIYGVVEGTIHDARVQLRGEPRQLGDTVPRRYLEIFGGDPILPGDSGSGRASLATWLTRDESPLTARVAVNRIWQSHFGEGLVRTENDFGARGARPTHPDLLDALASRFVANGWSAKALHREIVLSRTYRMSSVAAPEVIEADASNSLLARFPRRRLEAEAIRDALLSISGELDRTTSGPHPFPAVDTWGFTQHNPFSADYDSKRRSIYLMTQRLRRHPFLALFDGADTNASTPQRDTTTVPTQALFFLNDPFVHASAEGASRRWIAEASDPKTRLDLVFEAALGRPPSSEERAESVEFLDRYRSALLLENVAAEAATVSTTIGSTRVEPDDASRATEFAAWSALARTLFSRNEFIFID